MLRKLKSKEWEIEHSSLAKKSKNAVTYNDVRKYACEDIVKNLTRLSALTPCNIIEIPKNTNFNFIGRVNTNILGTTKKHLYNDFKDREFASFSTISKKNISRYKGKPFFIYHINSDDIVHIFPIDSCTDKRVTVENELTVLPSLWLTLKELNALTESFETYNQITCKTKRNGEIINPIAVLAINEVSDAILKIAEEFGISIVLIHPDEDAICYTNDIMYDTTWLNSYVDKMKVQFDIDLKEVLWILD